MTDQTTIKRPEIYPETRIDTQTYLSSGMEVKKTRISTHFRVLGPDNKYYLSYWYDSYHYVNDYEKDVWLQRTVVALYQHYKYIKYNDLYDNFGNKRFTMDPNQQSEENRLRLIDLT